MKGAQPTMTPAACVHHWLLSPPDGPTSVGVCLKCGDQREFSNSFSDAVDRAVQRRRGVKDVVVPRPSKGLAARISERPVGFVWRDD